MKTGGIANIWASLPDVSQTLARLSAVLCGQGVVLEDFLVGQNVLSVESHALENEGYYSRHSGSAGSPPVGSTNCGLNIFGKKIPETSTKHKT